MIWKALIVFIVIAAISSFVVLTPASSASTTISLDPNTRYQTFTGWEGTAQGGQLACDPASLVRVNGILECPAFKNYKTALLDQTVNDLGINRLRVEIRPGVENTIDYFSQFLNGQITERDWVHGFGAQPVNDNNNPNVINQSGFVFTSFDYLIDTMVLPIKQLVEARGEHLFINVCFVGFHTDNSTFRQFDNPQEYAEFVLAAYQHMQSKYGFVPDAWEVELEPDNTQFDGNKIGNAIKATASMLEARGFTPNFIVPSTANMSKASTYFTTLSSAIGDQMVRQNIIELSYHRYGGISDSALQWIGDKAASYGIGGAMLEHIGSGYQDLYKDLTLGNNTAWSQYTIAKPYYWGSDDAGGAYYLVDDTTPNNPKIIMASRTKFLRQYFMYIRSGAVRIKSITSSDTFNPVAFINSDGKYVVVVKANAGGSFSVQGLPAGNYGIKYTTQNEYDVDENDITISPGQLLDTNIPAAGAITIYAKTGSGPSSTPTPKPTLSPNLTPRVYLPFNLSRQSGVSGNQDIAPQPPQPDATETPKNSSGTGCFLQDLFR